MRMFTRPSARTDGKVAESASAPDGPIGLTVLMVEALRPFTASAEQPHAHQREQLLGVHWLGDVVAGAGIETLLPVALHGACSESEDGKCPELRHFPNLP